MTIRIRQIFKMPFINRRIERLGTLEPGEEFVFHRTTTDEDGRGEYADKVWIRGLSEESLEFRLLSSRHVPPDPGFRRLNPNNLQRDSYRELTGDEIEYVVHKSWGGKATGKWGQEVDVFYEPTLPSQAKR